MTADQLQRTRSALNLSKEQLAELISTTLERPCGVRSISAWENGTRPMPDPVARFMESLALEARSPLLAAPEEGGDEPRVSPDQAPAPGDEERKGTLPFSGAGAYARACEELWGIIALGTSSVGALVGSQALVVDGQIIDGDKQTLGQAWGRLAEENETLRTWIIQARSGGAWVQVALVTGQTLGKCVQNHYAVKQALHMRAEEESVRHAVVGDDNGQGPAYPVG